MINLELDKVSHYESFVSCVRKKINGFEDIIIKKTLLIKIQFGCLDMSAGHVLGQVGS